MPAWNGFGWRFLEPRAGWLLWDEASAIHLVFDGANWIEVNNSGSIQNAAMVSINTTADSTNRLAVKADGVLFACEDAIGQGDMRATLNKSSSAKDLGIVLQTGYSTRAMLGLFADDHFTLKVSPDGSTFSQAISVNKENGHIGLNGFTADLTHALAIKGTSVLFDAETDHCRFTLNKAASASTASHLFQTGYSGRAETGLIGNDQFAIKVSSDGTNWKEALVIDPGSGIVSAPFGIAAQGAPPFLAAPQGRLTLASGNPVMSVGVGNAATVFYTPHCGSYVPVFDGAIWAMASTGGELSQALSDSTKSPAGAIASTLYDLFVWNDAGTLRCTRGPGWTNSADGASTRGSGTGTTELEQFGGFWVNKHAIANGPPARRGTYVGSLKTNASAAVDFTFGGVSSGGTKGVLNLWNAYNRTRASAFVGNSADSWTYASAAWRPIAASANMQVDCVQGLPGDAIQATYGAIATSSTGFSSIGIGLNSTTAFSGHSGYIGGGGAVFAPQACFNGLLPIGASRLTALEYVAVGTLTSYGDAGNPAHLQTGLYVAGQF